jgi:pimeloyl-ACP methyl ester carboxylesterase
MPRPSLVWTALEVRAPIELVGAAGLAPWLTALVPRGDGHPVLVLPGFLAGDGSTLPLRRFLRFLGYRAHGYRLGRNLGPQPGVVRALDSRLRDLSDRYGESVSLVGWSLGGLYARELSRRHPARVRQLVTLAGPLRATYRREIEVAFDRALGAQPTDGAAVPATAILSRSDGVVHWSICRAEPGPRRETLEVPSSHIGMGWHPATLWIVAQRLAQHPSNWRPLDANEWIPRALGVRPARDTR